MYICYCSFKYFSPNASILISFSNKPWKIELNLEKMKIETMQSSTNTLDAIRFSDHFFISNLATKMQLHYFYCLWKKNGGEGFEKTDNNWDITGGRRKGCQFVTLNCKICEKCFMKIPGFRHIMRVNVKPVKWKLFRYLIQKQ